MNAPLYILALVGGVGIALQVGMNGAMRQATGSAAFAALTSFTVGLIALAAFLTFTRAGLPSRMLVSSAPAWAWMGGLRGAFYVANVTMIAPRIGAAAMLAFTMLGQLIASLVLDHYGWLGFAQHALSAQRLIGAGLLLSGAVLITR